ncbi:MAG: hypothetical protein JNL08_12605 [Planctomycetes bacterium]|nr:hypothetical protein [Planctomycetota bacterium]
MLQVDVATPIVVEAGQFDAQGRASRGWFVPALPASIGQPFCWQTWHGTPLGLGNLELTTLRPN